MFAQVVLEKGHICGNAEPQGIKRKIGKIWKNKDIHKSI
jgi:hypothetical protein